MFFKNIMPNKKVVSSIAIIILCFAIENGIYGNNIIDKYLLPGFFYFDFGFNLGVKPYMWPVIPEYALGYGLKYIPQQNKAAAYILGAAGCFTGTMLVFSAIAYGVTKIYKQEKKIMNSVMIQTEPDKKFNEDYKGSKP